MGIRLDVFVALKHDISRTYAQKLIDSGNVLINGKISKKPGIKLESGIKVTSIIPEPESLTLTPENIKLEIVFEDNDIIVIDKPAGMTVHPAPGNWSHTLVNALLSYCPDLQGISGTLRPGIVHRLDKDTSGLIVVAKNDRAQESLSKQIKERSVKKQYLALLVGHLSPKHGAIEGPIGRDPRDRKKMAVVAAGRSAKTMYQVLRYINGYTYIEATMGTGRTHQIRVHFTSIGFPLFGDAVYGKPSTELNRHFLHAHILGFKMPSNNEYVEFKSDLPPELKAVLRKIDAEYSG
ncbi:MAG: RluA family pseudouridine synthase [Chloroflexi bacterium]|nr:RluA family pseudouridine synthase [Chloroflexota bacterium]